MCARVDTGSVEIKFSSLRQGSSVVEQGTHKPLVGSSTLPPGTTFSGSNRGCSEQLQLEEVFQQVLPFGRQDGFRMKVHAMDRQRLVAQAHDLLFRGLR